MTISERLHAEKMKAFFDLADQSGDTMISRKKWKDVMASHLESMIQIAPLELFGIEVALCEQKVCCSIVPVIFCGTS